MNVKGKNTSLTVYFSQSSQGCEPNTWREKRRITEHGTKNTMSKYPVVKDKRGF